MIIKIGEVEWRDLQRKFSMPRAGECPHKHLQYIEHGELLLCTDCQRQVTAVWALQTFFRQYLQEKERLDRIRDQIKADEERLVVHRAALAVQDAWRSRKMIPCCPHCRQPIDPPAGFGKKTAVSRFHYGNDAKPLEMRPNLKEMNHDSEPASRNSTDA